MNDLQIFNSSEFGAVRTVEENGKAVKATGKGQQYFINLFLGEDDNHETI